MVYRSDLHVLENEYGAEGNYMKDLIEALVENAVVLYEYTPVALKSFEEEF